MNRSYILCAVAGLLSTVGTLDSGAAKRLPIQEDKAVQMYAIGAGGTAGVWQLNLTDLQSPVKLNGSTYLQYTGSSNGGGGTFLSPEKVVGVKYAYGAYPFEATAAGGGDGPWSHSYYAASYYIEKVYDMAYDEKSDVIYCWYDVSSYVKALGVYDPSSHTVSRIGSAASAQVQGLAIDSKGQLWGVGAYGYVYKIDKTTGVATEVTGNAGCGVQFQTSTPVSAAIDPSSDVMYVVAKTGSYDTYSCLTKVDLNTYKGENLGALPGYYNCLYIAGSTIPEGAPAPAENLSALFNGKETVVTFTAPTKTAGGKNLSGTLTYSVSVDGAEAATGSVEAGKSAEVAINPEDGLHEIQVTLSNAEGTSKEIKTSVFSGYDVPGNISDLTAEADGAKVMLTWEAPEGIHGGLVDASKLSYTVSRDGEIIAEGLKTTETGNTVEGAYRQYTYAVTVNYAGENCESRSVNVLAGVPYTVPYALDLASVSEFGEAGLEVIDTNLQNTRPSESWKLSVNDGEKFLECYKQAYFYQSDFAYLPPVELKAGVNYSISFKGVATTDAWGTYSANLGVVIADRPSGTTDEYKLLNSYDIVPQRGAFDWNEYTVDFTVEKDGTYNLGFRAWDQTDLYGNYSVGVKDIAVSARFVIPQAVSDLSAVTEADNNRNVEVSFRLPTESTEGDALSSISKVEIIRNSEVIETLTENLVPGEKVIVVDENAPRGIKSYSVVAYCGDQSSKPSVVSVKVGYVNNLIVELLEAPATDIAVGASGVISVKVTNDGFEQVLTGGYSVELFRDGNRIASETGLGLATDTSETYTFNLTWDGELPAKFEYVVKVVFDGDEDLEDNETAPVEVSFSAPTSVGETLAGEVAVFVSDSEIHVSGADGETVTIASADGRLISAGKAEGEFRAAVAGNGIYVVTVGSKSFKIAL